MASPEIIGDFILARVNQLAPLLFAKNTAGQGDRPGAQEADAYVRCVWVLSTRDGPTKHFFSGRRTRRSWSMKRGLILELLAGLGRRQDSVLCDRLRAMGAVLDKAPGIATRQPKQLSCGTHCRRRLRRGRSVVPRARASWAALESQPCRLGTQRSPLAVRR
jgi:hypothetical protein